MNKDFRKKNEEIEQIEKEDEDNKNEDFRDVEEDIEFNQPQINDFVIVEKENIDELTKN